jgi:uncharacterized protein
MELTGQQLLPVPRDKVWSALLDPETLRAAIPGCEFVKDEGNGLYTVGMLAAVGPVKARFKGRMQQQDLQPPNRYTLSFEGDGGLAGYAKGSAEVELLEEGETHEHTRLNYRARAQIGGRMAQIGSRLVDATAAKMSAQFFERLTVAIAAPPGAQTRSGTAVPGAELAATGAAVPAPSAPAVLAAVRGMVTIQMPSWTFAFTLTALVALIGWLSIH